MLNENQLSQRFDYFTVGATLEGVAAAKNNF
jgi:hypothetical protein